MTVNWQGNLDELRARAETYLAPERVAHVRGCEQEAVSLARRWGAEESDAAVAGILHDITKKLRYKEQIALCKELNIESDSDEMRQPKLLHAVSGAYLAEREFGISPEIRDAIRWHTTAKADMTLLEKIIYLADYIEPTRNFEGVDRLRKLAYEDIDSAMALGLAMSLEDIESRGEVPYRVTRSAYEYYTGGRHVDT